MGERIDFWFDIASAYSFLAGERIETALAGHDVAWRLISLPHVFKAMNTAAPASHASKWSYALEDFARCCAIEGLPCAGRGEPVDARASRIVFWSLHADDPGRAIAFARRAMRRAWGEGLEVATAADVAACGVPEGESERRVADGAARARLVAETDAAVAAGVFGAPFFHARGRRFWGADRLDQLVRMVSEAA